MFPALDAKAAGYKVYAVIDASGDPSEMASRTTLARFIQAGIIPISANAVICEFHRTMESRRRGRTCRLVLHGIPIKLQGALRSKVLPREPKVSGETKAG